MVPRQSANDIARPTSAQLVHASIQQYMSNPPSETFSPSKSPKPSGNATPEVVQVTTSSESSQGPTETPQPTAEHPVSAPVIVFTTSPSPHSPTRSSSPGHRSENTSATQSPRSQSPSHQTPSNTTATMSSSSSSPGNTSTSGSTSGSNPSYQLPYAPFPYPMPANTRGSGQQSGGQGK